MTPPPQVCPDYEGLELGIGESLLMKAIAKSTGRAMKALKDDYVTIGDLGTVAKNSKGSQRTLFKPKPLTTSHVFKTLKDIAKLSGQSVNATHPFFLKKSHSSPFSSIVSKQKGRQDPRITGRLSRKRSQIYHPPIGRKTADWSCGTNRTVCACPSFRDA